MAYDGTTLPSGAHLTRHGCGESFPFTDDELAELDLLDADPDQRDRRVELYFFDGKLAVQPPPPGAISAPGSTAYPEWRRRAQETHDFQARTIKLLLRIIDADHEPKTGLPYRLTVGGTFFEDFTDDAGMIVHHVPANAQTGILELESHSRVLTISKLEAPTAPVGANPRLQNLCYGCHDHVPAALDDNARDALLRLQCRADLEPSGTLDEPTSSTLGDQHDA